MKEVGEIWRGEVMDSLVGVEEYFIINAVCDGKPVKLM